MFSLHGVWVSENYCFSRCTADSVLPALIAWCGWYWWGRDAGIELGEKLRFLLHRGEIFTFETCSEISLNVRAGCWWACPSLCGFQLCESFLLFVFGGESALGDKSIEWCCLWCAVVKPGKMDKSLALHWQVRRDIWILGIVVSLPVCVLEICRAHCISKLDSSEKHLQLCCISEVMGTTTNWCNVIQALKQCNGRFGCVSLAKALVFLGYSGVSSRAGLVSFASYLIVLVAVSGELDCFYIYYRQYVFLIITSSKNYGVGVHAQSEDTCLKLGCCLVC